MGLAAWDSISGEKDGIALLKEIKVICFKFESQKNRVQAIHEAKRRFFLMSQGRLSLQQHLEQFNNQVEVIKHCGGDLGMDPAICGAVLAEKGMQEHPEGGLQGEQAVAEHLAALKECKRIAEDRCLAMAFLLSCDRSKCAKLIGDRENDFLDGLDRFPKSLSDACHPSGQLETRSQEHDENGQSWQ